MTYTFCMCLKLFRTTFLLKVAQKILSALQELAVQQMYAFLAIARTLFKSSAVETWNATRKRSIPQGAVTANWQL